jgi:hypothetical protein
MIDYGFKGNLLENNVLSRRDNCYRLEAEGQQLLVLAFRMTMEQESRHSD